MREVEHDYDPSSVGTNQCGQCGVPWDHPLHAERKVLVRVTRHRARDRLERLVGPLGPERLTLHSDGEFYTIPARFLDDARAIPGVTLGRPKGPLHWAWKLREST